MQLAATSGQLALAAGDCERVAHLLRAVLELDPPEEPRRRGRLTFGLARAEAGRGRHEVSNDLLCEAIRLAAVVGCGELAVDAAVELAWPPDWRAGDRRIALMVELAEELHDDGPRRAAVLAARAITQVRVPISPSDMPQVAWVTRADRAQPLAEQALSMTSGQSDRDRLFTLVAWRSTNRRPAVLDRRLRVTEEGVGLAQTLLDHRFLVDMAVMHSVDRMESGDRGGFDRAVALAGWAESTGEYPRLTWIVALARASAALMDGDLDGAARYRRTALETGERYDLPGRVAAEILMAAQIALAADDREEMRGFLVPDDEPVLSHPIARSSVALMAAFLGEAELASAHARAALRLLDPETSLLLSATLMARAAAAVGDAEVMEQCRQVLSPWRGRFALDGHGWWCAGPVDLALAELAEAAGNTHEALDCLVAAEKAISAANDSRSACRAAELRRRLGLVHPALASTAEEPAVLSSLTEREREVLRLLARGHTNARIGEILNFSTSTIRADTVSIYRKLGVNGRPEAAALAVAAGLADVGERPDGTDRSL